MKLEKLGASIFGVNKLLAPRSQLAIVTKLTEFGFGELIVTKMYTKTRVSVLFFYEFVRLHHRDLYLREPKNAQRGSFFETCLPDREFKKRKAPQKE